MAKHRLSAATCKNAKGMKGKKRYLSDGGGLLLQVSPSDSKSWVFRRRQENGKVPEVGLGSFDDLSLAEARDIAAEIWKLTSTGVPVSHARNTVLGRQAAEVHQSVGLPAPGTMTFDLAAAQFIKSVITPQSKKGSKTVPQWESSLLAYASPIIGHKDIGDLNTDDAMAVLTPIWLSIPETASRVRSRCENIVSWAIAAGHRQDKYNPFVWRGALSALLPARSKVQPLEHFAAMDWRDLPALYAELIEKDSTAARALMFTMLTAGRTGEVIAMEWTEVKGDVWTVPGSRMKMKKAHKSPLSNEALKLLESIDNDSKFVFSGGMGGRNTKRHISNLPMLQLLQRMRGDDCTVHGMRSCFRTWAAETTDAPAYVVEMCLAHAIRGIEASYQRGDLMKKRAALMEAWSDFLTGK